MESIMKTSTVAIVLATIVGCAATTTAVYMENKPHVVQITGTAGSYHRPEPVMAPAPAPVIQEVPKPQVLAMRVEERAMMASSKPAQKKVIFVNKPTTTPDVILDQLSTPAAAAFSVPTSANIKEEITAQLVVDPNKTIDDAVKQLTVKGQIVKEQIKISKVVTAKLVAPNFTVTAIEEEQQAISETAPTIWHWTLVPKTTGPHPVHVTIDAIVTVNDKEKTRTVRVFDQMVDIRIKPQQLIMEFFKQYWQWIVSTLIIPLGVWFWKSKQKS